MASWNWFGRIHQSVYEKTGGRIGARMAGIEMLLLTTTGRRSGRPRTLPLACFPDGNDLVVVASNSGQAHDPAWWLNLREKPEAEVRLGRQRFRVRAALATPEERERLWPQLKQHNRSYARYERITSREIPVVVLRRIDG